MNIILNPGQSNTRQGDINLPASVDLTGKENLLWKIVNNSGVANFALPTTVLDMAPWIGASGDVAGNNVAAEVPRADGNCRVLLDGTCSPGDMLSLSPTNWGRLVKPAVSSGATNYWAIAEEVGVAGQRVLCRFVGPIAVTL